MQKIIDLRLRPEQAAELEEQQKLLELAAKESGIDKSSIVSCQILKRSIDARSRKVLINIRVQISTEKLEAQLDVYSPKQLDNAEEVHIIGAGPAGLFCALELIANGKKPVIIERGKKVRDRRRDLAKLNKDQIVDPNSNYCFGEGGAGTYSDGKLYTRSKKRGEVDKVLKSLVQFGADQRIMVDAHPHIGTNKLPGLIENIREFILSCGGEIHFEHRLTDLEVSSDRIQKLQLNDHLWLPIKNLVLATGHSARDIFRLLHHKGIQIEAKAFALGLRVEHPQSLINQIQYGKDAGNEYLPPATYRLVKQVREKGVYSFCMCPGGIIAACATQNGEIVTNGWSPSKRNNPYANSGMVVEVEAEDWVKAGYDQVLGAMEFQAAIEKKAHAAVNETELKGQIAPAARLQDFVDAKVSADIAPNSYFPGTAPAAFNEILPPFVYDSLREAFRSFGKQMKGYLSNEAVVLGVESRTSSPISIPRDYNSLQHIQIKNLFPSGEGAGYAGGIVSAAMDGIAVANALK